MDIMAERTFAKTGLLVVASVLTLIAVLPAASCEGCFSIVVGRKASADGFVMMAHNEDDAPPQIVNHRKIPRRTHAPGEKVRLLNGGELDQVEQTWAYIWSQMPGMLFSDSYINEWGVSIASDNCPSREDRPEITDGGIGYMLRRLVAERAKTACEGVLLAGRLVERFGYIDSGRTYIICDPDEGWLFCVVKGKHWLAQRVGDNEVAMVANTYTVRRADLSDKDAFLACNDIIAYARSRGWYDPEKDGPFDFAAVYADPAAASHPSNLNRQRTGLNYVSAAPIPAGRTLPFSIVPRQQVSVAMLMQVLRHDNQGKAIDFSSPPASLHEGICRICSGATQTSFVAQLRKDRPLDVGIVYWVCLASPRTSFYIPFHFGISEFSEGFCSKSQRPSQNFYDAKVSSPFKADALQAFWTFSNFYDKVNGASADTVAQVKARAEEIEKRAFALQGSLEESACRLYTEDKTAAKMLADYSKGIYLSSLEAMEKTIIGLADER
jgi:dipeptidase